MLFRCVWAEVKKCRRAPVWLAFLALPLFPAILGTGNYLSNMEVLDSGWYSLWSPVSYTHLTLPTNSRV